MEAQKKLTAEEAIKALALAIETDDKKAAIELLAPDDRDSMPDWMDESDNTFNRWFALVEKAEDKFIFSY